MFLIGAHLWRYALYRAYLNLIGEASRYYLAWLWWFLEPIAMTAVFFFVFAYLRAPNVENFQFFLLIGVTTWLWFANGVGNSSESLTVARTIISQMPLPKLLFPFTSVLSASLKHIFVFAIVLIVMASTFGASYAWFYLPILLFTQFTLILACACSAAFLCSLIRDARFVIRSGLTLMMFCSGIFFAVDSMPPAYREVFRLNPMAILIEDYRLVFLSATVPELASSLRLSGICVVWLYVLQWAYGRWDLTLTRRIIS